MTRKRFFEAAMAAGGAVCLRSVWRAGALWLALAASSVAQMTLSGTGTIKGAGTLSSASSGASQAQIAPELFSLHVHASTNWPTVPTAVVRLWDTSMPGNGPVSWGSIHTANGTYDWSKLDAWIATANAANAGLYFTFGKTPSWASSNAGGACGANPNGSCFPPNDVATDGSGTDQHVKDFVAALMAHLATADPNHRFKYFEIWNEPQGPNPDFYQGTIPQLARVAKDVYTTIKASARADVVVTTPAPSGGLGANGPAVWFPNYCSDASLPMQYADAIAFHTYNWSATPGVYPKADDVLTMVTNVKSALAGCSYATGKALWASEGGWGSTSGNGFSDVDMHAGYLAQSYLLHASAALGMLAWYAWDNSGGSGLETGGVIEKSGIAYGQMYDWLVGAITGPAAQDANHTWTVPVTRLGGYQALAVWNRTADTSYTPDPMYTRYRDLDGNVIALTGSPITARYKPVLLESAAPLMVQIATSTLAGATQNQAYSVTLAASGGTSPYAWQVRSGALPAGLSLNASSGVISGTPTTTGIASFQIGVLDANRMAHSKNFALTVSTATAGAMYCAAGDVVSFGASMDGPAQLPTACTYTAMSGSPSPGSTVTATSCAQFATLLAGVTAGQTIVVPSSLSCTGSYTLPAVSGADSTHWVTIRSDQTTNAAFPAEGTRATPCQIGVASVAGRPAYACTNPTRLMPQFNCNTTNCQVFATASGANYYRLIGMEVTNAAGTKDNNYLLNIGGGADHIILDRMVIHAQDNDTFATAGEVKGGVQTNGGTHLAVIDSYLYNFMCVHSGACTDAQAIAGGNGSTPAGPITIWNNFLEASGESFIFGGGSSTTTPTDVIIARNHSFKPLTWFLPTGGASAYPVIKNLGETKNCSRCFFEGNIFENNWQGFQGDQLGTAVLLTPKSQSSYTSGTVNTASPDLVTATAGSFTSDVTRVQIAGAWYTVTNWLNATQVNVMPDPGNQTGANAARICRPGLAPNAITQDVTFRLNIIAHATNGIGASTARSDCLDEAQGIHDISIHDNIFDDINGPAYSNNNSPCCNGGFGVKVVNDHLNPTAWPSNITINHNTHVGVGFSGGKIAGLGYISGTTNSFEDYFANFTVTNNVGSAPYGVFYDSSSTFNTVSTGMNQLGCPNHDGVNCTWTWTNNLLVSGIWSGQTNNAPYPGTCGSATCNPSAGFATIFASYNNGNGGDYHLAAGSPYKNAGTDGKDLGANVDAVNAAVAGVN